jgi:outer membrane protein assembly factor BamB
MAVEAESGRALWQTEPTLKGTEQEYFPQWRRRGEEEGPRVDPALNPAADGDAICLIDGGELVCLSFKTGEERWRRRIAEGETAAKAGTLIVQDGVALHADPTRLIALSLDSGEQLWSRTSRTLGHLWFEWKDVFVVDGIVWTWSEECAEREFRPGPNSYRRRWPINVDGYDLHTGALARQVSTEHVLEAPHHHRCYRNKATSRYLISSRRGSEFLDLTGGKHTVHNWVRGTCHLGMFPANGLQYVPPHPCVCYISEQINGFTALAPEIPAEYASDQSEGTPVLQRGPAYGSVAISEADLSEDWPTYRADSMRSGAAGGDVPQELVTRWRVPVAAKLSPPIAVEGRVYLSATDEHRVIALDAEDGRELWDFTAEARVDSPPTWRQGTLLFGSTDGSVYCVRAGDGELIWRFQATPRRMIGAFGQLESARPVHGSVVVQDGLAYFAAGRSSHLDGGIRLFAVDAVTGELRHERLLTGPKLDSETILENVSEEQGALTDIMLGDGERVYMRAMAFNADLSDSQTRTDRIRPVGGFLDDSYFRRAPWRLGRNWGRVIAYDEHLVYAVRMFESLHGLDPNNFFTAGDKGYRLLASPRQEFSQVDIPNSDSLLPRGKPLTVEAWVLAKAPDGVVLARGGSAQGYTLLLREGKPRFAVRINDGVFAASAEASVVGRWVHLAGVLTEERQLQVYVDGRLNGSGEAPSPIGSPGQNTQIGADAQTGVGDYESPFAFTGVIDEVSIYHRALSADEIARHAANPGQSDTTDEALVLHFSFDSGQATDESGNENHGECKATAVVEGRSGQGMSFAGGGGLGWSFYLPIRVRAMVPAGERLLVAGPPDVVDPDDPLGAFEGRKGALLRVFSTVSGEQIAEYELRSPPVFNGMAAARGRLFLTTVDGHLVCMAGPEGSGL